MYQGTIVLVNAFNYKSLPSGRKIDDLICSNKQEPLDGVRFFLKVTSVDSTPINLHLGDNINF